MRRTSCAVLSILVLLCLGFRVPNEVRADPVSTPQLAAAALGPADLAGWSLTNENPPDSTDSQTYEVGYHRLLTVQNPTLNGYATLDITINVLASAVPAQPVAPYISNPHAFDRFNTMANFTAGGSLGVGNVDNSVSFEAPLPNTTALYTVYLDVFLRGRMVVQVRYGALAGQDDPTALARLASMQDQKLLAAASLPPALLNPAATPTSLASHRWYTSTDAAATLYYCDDDPAWKQIDLPSLDSYGTVADLLARYPGRALNRSCADGATGP